MKMYYQCRLKRGNSIATAWIETRGAIIDADVQFLPSCEWWTVVQVFKNICLDEEQLKAHQRLNRKSLSSIKSIHD